MDPPRFPTKIREDAYVRLKTNFRSKEMQGFLSAPNPLPSKGLDLVGIPSISMSSLQIILKKKLKIRQNFASQKGVSARIPPTNGDESTPDFPEKKVA